MLRYPLLKRGNAAVLYQRNGKVVAILPAAATEQSASAGEIAALRDEIKSLRYEMESFRRQGPG
jgi:CHAD domain-containing protein